MSRSGYHDDCEHWVLIRWRGAVKSAIRGKRGQKLLTELLAALDAMPEKRLIEGELQDEEGEVCALGAVGQARGLDVSRMDPEEHEVMGAAFDIAPALVQEIEFMNDDEGWYQATPEARWTRMRAWVAKHISDPVICRGQVRP